jgi:hypothetical protein
MKKSAEQVASMHPSWLAVADDAARMRPATIPAFQHEELAHAPH